MSFRFRTITVGLLLVTGLVVGADTKTHHSATVRPLLKSPEWIQLPVIVINQFTAQVVIQASYKLRVEQPSTNLPAFVAWDIKSASRTTNYYINVHYCVDVLNKKGDVLDTHTNYFAIPKGITTTNMLCGAFENAAWDAVKSVRFTTLRITAGHEPPQPVRTLNR